MITGSFPPKPSQWNVDRTLTSPEWSWFWDNVVVAVPLLHGAGPPYDVVSNAPLSSSDHQNNWKWSRRYGSPDLDVAAASSSAELPGSEIVLPPFTAFAVVTPTSSSSNDTIMGYGGSSGGNGWKFGKSDLGDVNEFLLTFGGVADMKTTGTDYWVGGERTLVSITVTTGSADVYKNGKFVQTITTTPNNINDNIQTGFLLGTAWDGSNWTNQFSGQIEMAALLDSIVSEDQHRQWAKDPFGPFRHKQDTIHTSTFPVQRNVSQEFSRKIPPKPSPWNLDVTLVDPQFQGFWNDIELCWPLWEPIDATGEGGEADYGIDTHGAVIVPVSLRTAVRTDTEFGPALDVSDFSGTGGNLSPKDGWTGILGNNSRTSIVVCKLTDQSNQHIIKWGTAASDQWWNYDLVSGVPRLSFGGSFLDATSDLSDGVFHVVVATYDGTTARVYVDGIEENSTTKTLNTTADSAVTLTEGHSTTVVGGAWVWNRALTRNEIELFSRDPFGMFRHKQDTIHPTVYPSARNVSQKKLVRELPPKPSSWNYDASLIDPELEPLMSKATVIMPVLETGNFVNVYGRAQGSVSTFSGNAKTVMTEYGPALDFDGTNNTKITFDKHLPDLIGTETDDTGSYWTLSLFRSRDIGSTDMSVWGSSYNAYHGIRRRNAETWRYRSYGTGEVKTYDNTDDDDGKGLVKNSNDLLLTYTQSVNVSGSNGSTKLRIYWAMYNLTTGGSSWDSEFVTTPLGHAQTDFTLGMHYDFQTVSGMDGQIFYFVAGPGIITPNRWSTSGFNDGTVDPRQLHQIISEKLVNDPFSIFRQYRDTQPAPTFPVQRNFSQTNVTKPMQKPSPWNVDPTLVDPKWNWFWESNPIIAAPLWEGAGPARGYGDNRYRYLKFSGKTKGYSGPPLTESLWTPTELGPAVTTRGQYTGFNNGTVSSARFGPPSPRPTDFPTFVSSSIGPKDLVAMFSLVQMPTIEQVVERLNLYSETPQSGTKMIMSSVGSPGNDSYYKSDITVALHDWFHLVKDEYVWNDAPINVGIEGDPYYGSGAGARLRLVHGPYSGGPPRSGPAVAWPYGADEYDLRVKPNELFSYGFTMANNIPNGGGHGIPRQNHENAMYILLNGQLVEMGGYGPEEGGRAVGMQFGEITGSRDWNPRHSGVGYIFPEVQLGGRNPWDDASWPGKTHCYYLWSEKTEGVTADTTTPPPSKVPTYEQLAMLHEDPWGPFRHYQDTLPSRYVYFQIEGELIPIRMIDITSIIGIESITI